MKYGYARVSSSDQNLDSQINELQQHCDEIVQEKRTGVDETRELYNLINKMQKGDVLVVTRYDRIARSLSQLLKIVDVLNEKECDIIILKVDKKNTLDTTTAYGKLQLNLMASLAQFERDINKERQSEGIAIAKAKGVYKKRRKLTDGIVEAAIEDYKNKVSKKLTVPMICKKYGLSKATLYNELKKKKSTEI